MGLCGRNVQTIKQLLVSPSRMHSSLYWSSAIPLSAAWTNPQQNYSWAESWEQGYQPSRASWNPWLGLHLRFITNCCHANSVRSGTQPLSKLCEGELVRMKRGREWTPGWLPSNTRHPVRTPDGAQMHRNRIHLQPTKKEAPPVTSQAWETSSDAPIPIMPSKMDMDI